MDCEWGRMGGNGGNGGQAGKGGKGGDGGNGGSILIQFATDNTTPSGIPILNMSAGAGGQGGGVGAAGAPGNPGTQGLTSGVFSASSDCHGPGPIPVGGSAGGVPNPSSLGSGASGLTGKFKSEQKP
jgi:hypothetical protein